MSIVFAATYPERTSALILCGAFPRRAWAPDYLWGQTDEQLTARRSQRNGARVIPLTQPLHSLANDQELRRFEGRMERQVPARALRRPSCASIKRSMSGTCYQQSACPH